jgi:hypothetical protein
MEIEECAQAQSWVHDPALSVKILVAQFFSLVVALTGTCENEKKDEKDQGSGWNRLWDAPKLEQDILTREGGRFCLSNCGVRYLPPFPLRTTTAHCWDQRRVAGPPVSWRPERAGFPQSWP